MTLFLNILLFPLDLIYLTWDMFRITMDSFVYFPNRSEHDQPCIHCKNTDCGYRPRRLPPGLKKYRNRWVGCWVQPCIRKDISKQRGQGYACCQDGSFVKYSGSTRLFFLFLLAFWVGVFLIVRMLFF